MATIVRQLWLTSLYLCISVTMGGGTVFADFAGIRIVSVGDSYASGEGAPDSSGPFASHPIWKGDNTEGEQVSLAIDQNWQRPPSRLIC